MLWITQDSLFHIVCGECCGLRTSVWLSLWRYLVVFQRYGRLIFVSSTNGILLCLYLPTIINPASDSSGGEESVQVAWQQWVIHLKNTLLFFLNSILKLCCIITCGPIQGSQYLRVQFFLSVSCWFSFYSILFLCNLCIIFRMWYLRYPFSLISDTPNVKRTVCNDLLFSIM